MYEAYVEEIEIDSELDGGLSAWILRASSTE